MPATRKLFLKKAIQKLSSKTKQKMVNSFASPENNGFRYLRLFKEEHWEEIAEHLKQNPTVDDIVNLVLQWREALFEDRVKYIQIDNTNNEESIDIEYHPDWEIPYCECRRPHTHQNGWWTVKSLLYHLYNHLNLKNYKFM